MLLANLLMEGRLKRSSLHDHLSLCLMFDATSCRIPQSVQQNPVDEEKDWGSE